jgi:hypothetical protein
MDTALWQEISSAIGGGSLDRLSALWDRCPDGEAALRCVIAHYAADLEPELADETLWDERALAAWSESDATDWEAIGISEPLAMLPSLHLNLGDDYQRAGADAQARQHLALARAHADLLSDDGYGRTVRTGIDGLAERCGVDTA